MHMYILYMYIVYFGHIPSNFTFTICNSICVYTFFMRACTFEDIECRTRT